MKISITGTPGTGKTELSNVLGKKLGFKVIELNDLARKQSAYCRYDRKRETKIVDIGKLSIPEGNCILVSHYSHDVPNDLTIVLRCDIEILRKRMEKKGFSDEKINENIQAEIFGICLEESKELGRHILEIDTSKKSSRDIAKTIKI